MFFRLMAPFAVVGRAGLDLAAAVGQWGLLVSRAGRGLALPGTWAPLLVGELARIGVASVPIALFISAFTGIVLALQASYTFTGAVPVYFVGTLVGKTMLLELGPVLTGLALAGRVGANIAAPTTPPPSSEAVSPMDARDFFMTLPFEGGIFVTDTTFDPVGKGIAKAPERPRETSLGRTEAPGARVTQTGGYSRGPPNASESASSMSS